MSTDPGVQPEYAIHTAHKRQRLEGLSGFFGHMAPLVSENEGKKETASYHRGWVASNRVKRSEREADIVLHRQGKMWA